jgi:thiol-disulfide isomerase/thioredoxin
MARRIDRTVGFMAAACAAVGGLAAMGKFNSMMNFPLVFAAVCLVFGSLSLWRERSEHPVGLRAVALAVGAALAVGGWMYQKTEIAERQADRRLQIFEAMEGTVVPGLAGLEPLNVDQATWDTAASLAAPATVVTFWARWCSPCWKEMAELETLYRELEPQGLRVVAVTRYDDPDDEAERSSDFDKAQSFLTSREITYPTAITDRLDLYQAYKTASPPSTYLVDDEGRVVDYGISLESVRVLMERAAAMISEGSAR